MRICEKKSIQSIFTALSARSFGFLKVEKKMVCTRKQVHIPVFYQSVGIQKCRSKFCTSKFRGEKDDQSLERRTHFKIVTEAFNLMIQPRDRCRWIRKSLKKVLLYQCWLAKSSFKSPPVRAKAKFAKVYCKNVWFFRFQRPLSAICVKMYKNIPIFFL